LNEVGMMKIMSAIIIALAITGPAAARTSNTGAMSPSAQNSGAGIYGFAGAEAGPAVRPGTVGMATATSKYNLFVSEQDAVNVPALPGTEAGPSVKPPHHLS
jgi:hypothetical protein